MRHAKPSSRAASLEILAGHSGAALGRMLVQILIRLTRPNQSLAQAQSCTG
jgi:hypothetical protein